MFINGDSVISFLLKNYKKKYLHIKEIVYFMKTYFFK